MDSSIFEEDEALYNSQSSAITEPESDGSSEEDDEPVQKKPRGKSHVLQCAGAMWYMLSTKKVLHESHLGPPSGQAPCGILKRAEGKASRGIPPLAVRQRRRGIHQGCVNGRFFVPQNSFFLSQVPYQVKTINSFRFFLPQISHRLIILNNFRFILPQIRIILLLKFLAY